MQEKVFERKGRTRPFHPRKTAGGLRRTLPAGLENLLIDRGFPSLWELIDCDCRQCKLQRLCRDKFQSRTVDAVAQTGGLGPVVKHVPEMAAATAAMHLLPHQSERIVGFLLYRAFDRRIKARPARA